jgi:hypothetical protein
LAQRSAPTGPTTKTTARSSSPSDSSFGSEEERREAWLTHRERITDWALEWTRPWGFFHYECGTEIPDDRAEEQRLIEAHSD